MLLNGIGASIGPSYSICCSIEGTHAAARDASRPADAVSYLQLAQLHLLTAIRLLRAHREKTGVLLQVLLSFTCRDTRSLWHHYSRIPESNGAYGRVRFDRR